jgi:hypothetical protein
MRSFAAGATVSVLTYMVVGHKTNNGRKRKIKNPENFGVF